MMKKRIHKNDKRGFTLIELMIVIAILSILMLVLFNIWLTMLRATRVMDSKVQMQDQARQAMQHMTANLRMAAILQGRDPAPPQFVNSHMAQQL